MARRGDISVLAQVDTGNGTAPHHFFGFDWKPCNPVGNWAAAATARPARFQLLDKAAAGRAEWPNGSIQAFPATECDGKPCFLEGSPMGTPLDLIISAIIIKKYFEEDGEDGGSRFVARRLGRNEMLSISLDGHSDPSSYHLIPIIGICERNSRLMRRCGWGL